MANFSLRVRNAKFDRMQDHILREYGKYPYTTMIPNPAYHPQEFLGPAYPNPNFHPNQWLDSPTNTVPDPLYDPNSSLPDPLYNPIAEIPNPDTKEQMCNKLIEERFLRRIWDNWENNLAIEAARATIDSTSPIV